MKPEISQKEKIIQEIAQKMKFIGTYQYFDRKELEQKTISELKEENKSFDISVNLYSNPNFVRIMRARWKGKIDPRWKPFIKILKIFANLNTDRREKKISRLFIKHACTSDLLFQYISSKFYVSLYNSTNEFNSHYFNKIIISYFIKAKLEELIFRHPMVFSYWEKYTMKLLIQRCEIQSTPMDYLSEDKKSLRKDKIDDNWFLELHDSLFKYESERNIIIKKPRKEQIMFGTKDSFKNISLYDYGNIFVDKLNLIQTFQR